MMKTLFNLSTNVEAQETFGCRKGTFYPDPERPFRNSHHKVYDHNSKQQIFS